jgi:7-cyano-7-deazaguanine reductase
MAKSKPSPNPASLIECFDNPALSPEGVARDYVIEHTHEEFTSVCPKTGHPDFGVVTLRYMPDKLCVELKSLKLYYQAFRNEGIFYEAVTNRFANDLAQAMSPKWLLVQTQWRGRGGIRSVITVEIGRPPDHESDEAFEDESDLDEATPRTRPGEDDELDDRPPPGFKD